jgi:hypothetical protein
MRFLLYNTNLHVKNMEFIETMVKMLGWTFGIGRNISDYDIIYSPLEPIDTSQYKDKKFIFGPHFSVYPESSVEAIKYVDNSVYIHPSEWAANIWRVFDIPLKNRIYSYSFPVNVGKFSPIKSIDERDKVFIYYKRRDPRELEYLENFLKVNNINYRIFDYMRRYNETEYLDYLRESKYGIILDAHESQGFAIEEALSCDVPLFVWNASNMGQEYGSNFPKYYATTIAYWDNRCGEYFYRWDELLEKFILFMNRLREYRPREYILENLTVEKCANRLKDLVNKI